jgi:two-component system response regulator FlrC
MADDAAGDELTDGLLDALIEVLDVREAFDRVSQLAQPMLPHDILGIIQGSENKSTLRLLASAGPDAIRKSVELPPLQPELLTQPWEFMIIDDLGRHPYYGNSPAARVGMQSALSIPIRFAGRLRAAVNFFSRQPARFSEADVPIARRIARYIALVMSHDHLAAEARRGAELRERAATLELLEHSLATLTDAGEVGDLFERLSALARQLLPYDSLALHAMPPAGAPARRYSIGMVDSGHRSDLVDVPPGFVRDPDWEYDLVDDVTTRAEPFEPLVAETGIRAILRVPVRLDGRFVAVLTILSRKPGLYEHHHVQIARRIADRLALGFARERGVEEAKRADAASERAARLESRVRTLTEELDARTGYRRVIGDSPLWKHVLTQATQVAATDTTVLVIGETGTGKEVVARLLHRASPRCDGPFVALNCAALPEHLLEAELFGFERGAFTGATQSKPGQIEQASGGVLFLDEVGEMTSSAQAKLLRVLQEREFQRLGGTRVLRADVRVVAATNRDLRKAIERGAFREDLYYRLNVFELTLPPLRARRDDILPLSQGFLHEIGRTLGRPPSGISREARQALTDYDWPGNVRELRNVLERAAILADGGLIASEHLSLRPIRHVIPTEIHVGVSETAPVGLPDLPSVERTMIERALQAARFNKSQAAKALGLTRAQLYVRLKRHGLE